MRVKRLVLATVGMVGVGLLTAVSVYAHHAFAAEFDADRTFKIQGTVTKVEWVNPHTWIYVAVKGVDGRVDEWRIEGGSPGALTRRGFAKSYLMGKEIVVEGFLAKSEPRKGNGRSLTYPDGRTLFMGSSGTGAPVDGKDSEKK